ncbi:MAG TPA: serine protease [Luteimonas sp.]|nr:serine protease [Luteimonas sp.]
MLQTRAVGARFDIPTNNHTQGNIMQDGVSGHSTGRAAWLARLLLVVAAGFAGAASAASIEPQLLPGIQAATFEVVAAKPVTDPLTYEKPLPLDLLPYQERTDKYYSIGTAFAIGGGRYVTAAHVLLVGVNSLWGAPALRDNSGHVYAIDKVQKFSLERDFVVFTLVQQPNDAALALDTTPTPGQVVYSVGNAYGTGVVVRDGLYTSDTPEDQDGRWKWMRFSAPASPGNSGGPLVDKDGKVIGVVLAKSPNENLNYALPISMVQDAPDHVASMDQRIGYQFDVFDSTLSNTLKAQFALPLGLEAFFKAYEQRVSPYLDAQLKQLLAKEPGRMFPNGTGSNELLNSVASMGDDPRIIGRDSSGNWVLAGDTKANVKLASNGYVSSGEFGKNMLFHVRRGDNVPADRFYSDAAVAIDPLLQAGLLKRNVGGQSIAVTGFGKPLSDATHVDAWGRRWQVRQWAIPYGNAILLMASLPVPDGYLAVARFSEAMQAHDQLINTEALTDFVYANYDGTLAQWKEFLAHKDLLPTAFKDIRIDFDYGHRFAYASDRVAFAYTPELQAIQPDSVLTLGFGFFPDHGKVAWDPVEIWVSAKANDNNYVMLVRDHAPPKDLDDDYQNDWTKLVNRQHPYDATARNKDDMTKITAVVGAPATASPATLYTATYTSEGAHPQDAMQAKLGLLLKDLHLTEQ